MMLQDIKKGLKAAAYSLKSRESLQVIDMHINQPHNSLSRSSLPLIDQKESAVSSSKSQALTFFHVFCFSHFLW
jgi:hypothetical protein